MRGIRAHVEHLLTKPAMLDGVHGLLQQGFGHPGGLLRIERWRQASFYPPRFRGLGKQVERYTGHWRYQAASRA